ncbi:MAG: hypothetical protein H0T61_12530 [Actinobacteria bacterium]|nr:hypothetical protein [Actinomycetota bacterium]
MPEETTRGTVVEPDGRTVVLTEDAWQHIRTQHPELAPYERAIMETISHPNERTTDVRRGRERYFASGKGPSRWLRVVVEFDGSSRGEVITAFGQRNDP